jgi:hypothetical protein
MFKISKQSFIATGFMALATAIFLFTFIVRKEKAEMQNIEKNEVTSAPSYSNTERHTILPKKNINKSLNDHSTFDVLHRNSITRAKNHHQISKPNYNKKLQADDEILDIGKSHSHYDINSKHKNLNSFASESCREQAPDAYSDISNLNDSNGIFYENKTLKQKSNAAVLVDLGESSMLTPEQNEDLQAMAESLVAKIDSAEPNISPTEFQEIFANEARKSDQSFRAKYGNISWMLHHIEAHHLANPRP